MPVSLPPLSRRRFLQGTLATSLFCPSLWADEDTASPDVWAFLSDTHIPGDRNKSGGKLPVKPVEHFAKIRADILSDAENALVDKPSGVIVTGDCVYIEGLPNDYVTLLEEFEPLRRSGLPVYFVMGNHDNREAFLNAVADREKRDRSQEIPDRLHRVVETPKANFFLLDSLERTNYTPGLLGEKQLQWLAEELDARRDKPAILFAHHYPDYTGKVMKNPHALMDTQPFFDCIQDRKQVKAFIFGHSHAWSNLQRHGIHLVNLPTTAWRFDPTQPCGWVLARLKDDGIALTLRSTIEPEHPKHNETVELTWR